MNEHLKNVHVCFLFELSVYILCSCRYFLLTLCTLALYTSRIIPVNGKFLVSFGAHCNFWVTKVVKFLWIKSTSILIFLSLFLCSNSFCLICEMKIWSSLFWTYFIIHPCSIYFFMVIILCKILSITVICFLGCLLSSTELSLFSFVYSPFYSVMLFCNKFLYKVGHVLT